MRNACSSCGLDFLQEQGYYVGAMYVNYLITAGIGLAAALLLIERVPLSRLVPALAGFALVFPLITYRWSKSLWLGLQRYIEERTTEESGIRNPESGGRPPTPSGGAGDDRLLSALFKPCPSCGRRLPPITGCTAGLISHVADALTDHDRERAIEHLLGETDWTRELAIGYLTCPHFVPASSAQCLELQETNHCENDPDIEKIFACWVKLDEARFSPGPGESLIDRLQQKPWECSDARIRAAWIALTDPENLRALEKWNALDVMNPTAREISGIALVFCRARSKR